MTPPVLIAERRGAVAVLTLNRSEVLNSFNTAMADALLRTVGELADDRTARAVVIAGAGGRAFCAGADIAEFGALASADQFHEFITHLSRAVEAVAGLPQPVIAAVDGLALGGGCELAMACDVRTVGEKARFGLPEIKLGLLPGLGGTQRAVRLLPGAIARRMLLTGDPIGAHEAHAAGFCEAPVEAGEAFDAAIALATRLAAGPPLAIGAAKDLVRDGAEQPFPAALELEKRAVRDLFATADGAEGVRAFLDKREATFTGE